MSQLETPIKIADWTFDHAIVDNDADVIYLSIGEPRPARSVKTAEGDLARYDLETGGFCGLTIIDFNARLEQNKVLLISVPTMQTESAPVDALRELVAC